MKEKYDIPFLVKVAQMYYIEDLKQEDIAKSLQLSRSLISMYLAEARELGIVEIIIRDPLLNNENLADTIIDLFKLHRCVIIPTSVRDERALRVQCQRHRPGYCVDPHGRIRLVRSGQKTSYA